MVYICFAGFCNELHARCRRRRGRILARHCDRRLGSRRPSQKKNALRRLFFEAFTLAAADLKHRVEAKVDDAPRKIPNLERQERRNQVAARLTGLTRDDGQFEDDLDCSNRLIDKAIEIYEENGIRDLGPEECTKMEMELRGIKKDPTFIPDAHGVLRMKSVARDPDADVSTELKLSFAYKRRGLATEMGGFLSFENHEKLANKLISALMADPPPGYAKVDMEQVLRADVVAWKLIAQRTRNGIKRNNGGARPCDLIIDTVLGLEEFTQALQPLQIGASKRVASRGRDTEDAAEPRRKKKRSQGDKIKDLRSQLDAKQQSSSRRREASVGRPVSSATSVKLPRPLIGKLSRTADTPPKRLCFAYNMRSCCLGARDGQECSKGWHLCMEPPGPCAKAHPCFEH